MIPIRGSVRSSAPAVVTIGLILLNAFVFYLESGLTGPALEAVVERWGVVPARQMLVLERAPERIDLWLLPTFSSMFLHGSLGHLVGNMFFLWIFGDGVENRLGARRFVLFYALCGVAAAAAQSWTDQQSSVPMIGASGAIGGLLGGYLVLYPRARITMLLPILFWPIFFELPAMTFLLWWLLEQVALGTLGMLLPQAGGGVAWWAHAGGFIAGAILVRILARPRPVGFRRSAYNDRRLRHHRY